MASETDRVTWRVSAKGAGARVFLSGATEFLLALCFPWFRKQRINFMEMPTASTDHFSTQARITPDPKLKIVTT